jgi:hypothetical protein
MKRYAKDPLLIVSVLLAATGAVQASTNYLAPLLTKYPTAFGLAMTTISIVTGTLTALKTFIANRPSTPQ